MWKLLWLMYADDGVLIEESALVEVCRRRKLNGNASKSKIMVDEREAESDCMVIKGGENLERASEFIF